MRRHFVKARAARNMRAQRALFHRSVVISGDVRKDNMRETLSLRGAHLRVSLGIFAGLIGVFCTELSAHADDTTTTALESPKMRTFGEKGDVVFPLLGASLGSNAGPIFGFGPLSMEYGSSDDGRGGRFITSSLALQPELDIFVARHFSIGGSLLAGDTHTAHTLNSNEDPATVTPSSSDTYLSVGLLPRIGYAIPVSDHVTIWPRLAGGLVVSDQFGNDIGPPPAPIEFHATVDVPIIYRIDRRFFASVAPELFVQGVPKLGSGSNFFASFGTNVIFGLVL